MQTENIFSGTEVPVNPETFQNDLVGFRNRDDVLTLLIHMGYLAFRQDRQTACLPNEEIRMELQPVNTTEMAIPYENHARVPVEKYRDVLGIRGAMQDGNGIHVQLGAEIQSKVHYEMPVKDMLYDAINYVSQVGEARSSYMLMKHSTS